MFIQLWWMAVTLEVSQGLICSLNLWMEVAEWTEVACQEYLVELHLKMLWK